MKRQIFYIILTLLTFSVSIINAQNPWETSSYSKAGNSGFTFLKIIPTARIAGMGNAFSSISNDINAIYVNPAGITEAGNYAFNVSNTKWLVNSNYYTAAASLFIGGFNYIGVSVVALIPEKTPERITTLPEHNGLTGRNISMYDYSVGLTYAAKISEQLSLGIKLKYVNETIMYLSASSLLIDLGSLYDTQFETIRIAMGLRNFGSDAQYPNRILFKMPIVFNIGVSCEVYGQDVNSPVRVTLSGEASMETDYEQRYQIGTEIWIMKTIALRGGYMFNQGTKDPWGRFNYKGAEFSLGFGGKINVGGSEITVDFSYTKNDKLFQNPLRFSIGGAF